MLTINGKPFSEKTFKDEINKELFKGIADDLERQVRSLVTPEEAAQLKIDLIGDNLDELSMNIDGPDDIVAKVKKALDESETD